MIKLHYLSRLFIYIVLMAIVNITKAEDILTIESNITASQEQPKLLVIIPWKKTPKPETINDNILDVKENFFLQPLERKSFRRYSTHLQLLLND